jgi:hypothetical protein
LLTIAALPAVELLKKSVVVPLAPLTVPPLLAIAALPAVEPLLNF